MFIYILRLNVWGAVCGMTIENFLFFFIFCFFLLFRLVYIYIIQRTNKYCLCKIMTRFSLLAAIRWYSSRLKWKKKRTNECSFVKITRGVKIITIRFTSACYYYYFFVCDVHDTQMGKKRNYKIKINSFFIRHSRGFRSNQLYFFFY